MKQVIDYNRLLNPVVDYPETMFTYRSDGYDDGSRRFIPGG